MDAGRIFSKGGNGFFQTELKIILNNFPGGAKNGKISFYPLETKKTTLFAENLLGKFQIPWEICPPPTPMVPTLGMC